jgi:hypothetical protein
LRNRPLETLVVALRGSAPHGASRDRPPAPRRLGKPSPCTSPISDVLRRRRGHCLAGSRTGGKLARQRTSRCVPSVHPRDRDRHHPAPCGAKCTAIGTPSVVSVIDRVAPAAESVSAFLVERAAWTRAPFSPRSRRLVCQHVGAESSSASAVSPIRLAAPRCVTTRDASDRLLPSHVLRTSTRASPALDASRACAPARSRRSPASRQCDSLRWAARLSWCHRGGRCLPVAMRAVRTSGIPVASSTGGLSLARPAHPWKPPRLPSTRSRERCGRTSNPRCLPSSETPCPATPSRAPGSGLSRVRGLATATPVLDAFAPPRVLANPRELGPRPRAPLPTGDTLL